MSRQFRLKAPTLAVEPAADGSRRVPVTIPAGSIVRLVSEAPDGAQFVDVTWSGRVLAIFYVDPRQRGEEIAAAGS
jgi:hypothetical protein